MPQDQVLLRVTGLGKRFGGVQAVDNLDFEVGRGEVLGLIGPNGAGKTTRLQSYWRLRKTFDGPY